MPCHFHSSLCLWCSSALAKIPVILLYLYTLPCRRCDIIANGVINAAQAIGLKKPVIIRLKGTNVEVAKKLIAVSEGRGEGGGLVG